MIDPSSSDGEQVISHRCYHHEGAKIGNQKVIALEMTAPISYVGGGENILEPNLGGSIPMPRYLGTQLDR